jgi:hypothetical protein
MNRKIFAALKPGGRYVVVDHFGAAGHGITPARRCTASRRRSSSRRSARRIRARRRGAFMREPADTRDKSSNSRAVGQVRAAVREAALSGAPVTEPNRLDLAFVSDVACPWCAIGLASLEQALARLNGDVRNDIAFEPFELNPDMGAEGDGAHCRTSPASTAARPEQVAQVPGQDPRERGGRRIHLRPSQPRVEHVHRPPMLHWPG